MPTVFLDSTVLSNFALIGRTDLVYSLWHDSARTTKAVMEEYQAGSDVQNLPEKAWEKLVVHERSGKSAKDRYVPLPHRTLNLLRSYWITHCNPLDFTNKGHFNKC
jgi:hypothetical protein